MRKYLVIALLSLAFASAEATAQDPKALAPKGVEVPTPVISVPVEKRLTWENHRLRSANIALQIENMKKLQADEDKAAEAIIVELQATAGERYGPRVNPQSGVLEFFLTSASSAQTTKPVEVPKGKAKP